MVKNKQYDEYLTNHIGNVQKCYQWLKENILNSYDLDYEKLDKIIAEHDKSKYSEEEYDAYANYFYGDKNQEEFDKAWLHHQKENPHHWQYWVLINDEDGTQPVEMPIEYIIEMVCDWWSFSWKSKNLNEIFKWYKEHENKIVLHKNSLEQLEKILKDLNEKLEEKHVKDLFGL